MEKLADRCVKGARAGVGLALWDLHPCVLTSAARPAGSRLLLLLTPVFTSTRSDVDTPLSLFPFSRACGAVRENIWATPAAAVTMPDP